MEQPLRAPAKAKDPAAEPVRKEERFLRGQLRPQRDARQRPRFRLLRTGLLLASSAVLGAGIWSAVASGRAPELVVHRILVEGNARLSDQEILELTGVDESTNILTLDLDEVKRKLLRSPWVRDVELKRLLPGTLTLSISERTPVAVAVMDALYLLAEDGVLLGALSPHEDLSELVLVRGLEREEVEAPGERALLAGRLAGALHEDDRLSLLVSELDVAAGGSSISLQLRNPPITLLVSEETMTERLLATLPLLAGILERYPSLGFVDLRFDDRLYLRLDPAARAEPPSSLSNLPGGASF